MQDKFPTESKTVDINLLIPNRWNPNEQTEFIYEKVKDSIERYGFLDPVLVRKVDDKYEIIDGEHRWKGLKEKGYTQIKIEDFGEISDYDAMILTEIMNNARGQDDVLKRAKMFNEIPDNQLGLLPFESSQIEEEKKLLDFDFDSLKRESEQEQSPTRSLMFALTEEEWRVVQMAIELTKKQGSKALFEFIDHYLDLRVADKSYKKVLGTE